MAKGPDGMDRSGGDRLIQAFAAALGPNAVQVINKPDGNRALAISIGGGGVSAPDPMVDRLRIQSWMVANAKPDAGTQEDMDARREALFEKLRNITPEVVMDLGREYFRTFPKHPGADDYGDIANTGASILSNHEGYFFDPDRVVEMCKALQDAVRKIAQEIEGPVIVLEAGYGLGFVALSALALNDELGDRVRVIGLELNKATAHRAAQIADYYGIKEGDIALAPLDARKVRGLPDNVHILVAEHFAQGVFSIEPLHEVHRNLIPQLKAPFYIIPEGLEVHGRVVSRDGYVLADEMRTKIGEKLTRGGVLENRVLEPADIAKMFPGVNQEIMRAALLTRVKFADVLNGGWNGILNLKMSGEAVKNGKGFMQLKGVPTFHTDIEGEQPALGTDRFYSDEASRGVYFGTSINQWGHVRDKKRVEQYLRSPAGRMGEILDPFAHTMKLMMSTEFTPTLRMDKGRTYVVSVRGRVGDIIADLGMEEVQKGKKKR